MSTVPLRNAHVIVFHRWRDAFADYRRYLDHDANRVTYVTTPVSRDAVPAGAAEVVTVADTQDLAAVRAAIAAPVARHGAPAAVIALQEGDFAVVAQLRADYGSLGRTPDQLHHFLHKHAMLDAAAATGVEVPPYQLVTSKPQLARFVAHSGWPVITKKMYGGASKGVRRLDGPADLTATTVRGPLLVQQHLPYPVYHVDGIWDGTRLGPWRLSAYVNLPGTTTFGCLPFSYGDPIGSVEVDDPGQRAVVGDFLGALIPGMSRDPWIFHLEVFLDGSRCVFLEVGARPGGAEIPFIWRELHGIDLMEWEFGMQCGRAPSVRSLPSSPEVGGWLLVPLTAPRPCQVVGGSGSMLGTSPTLYGEAVPPPGTQVPASDASYELVGGRFRYRGATTAEVRADILHTATTYRVHCAPQAA